MATTGDSLPHRHLLLRLANSSPCVVHNKHAQLPGCCTVVLLQQRNRSSPHSSLSVHVSVCPSFLHSLTTPVRFLGPSHAGQGKGPRNRMAMSNSGILGNVNLLLLFRDSQLRVGLEEMLNFELLNTDI